MTIETSSWPAGVLRHLQIGSFQRTVHRVPCGGAAHQRSTTSLCRRRSDFLSTGFPAIETGKGFAVTTHLAFAPVQRVKDLFGGPPFLRGSPIQETLPWTEGPPAAHLGER